MDWRLLDFCRTHRVNQTALAEELVLCGWAGKRTAKGLTRDINNHCHSVDTFLRRRDTLRWWFMYRRYLNASPMELMGVKTDDEAVAGIIQAQAQIANPDVIIEKVIVAPIEPIESVGPEILDRYFNRPVRKSI